MNDVKLWGFTLCAAALAAAFIDLLSPKRMKKPLEIVTRLFLLLCLIAPLAKLPALLPKALQISPQAEFFQLDVNAAAENAARQKITGLIADKLAENGIMPLEIRIDITVTDKSLVVDGVFIALENKDEAVAGKARQIVKESFGFEAKTA